MPDAGGYASGLGATLRGDGTAFALRSDVAERVELCLYEGDPPGTERARHEMSRDAAGVWHALVPGVGSGTLYGYRVHGPYVPAEGRRANPAKLLLDPYGRAFAGTLTWASEVFGYRNADPLLDDQPDPRDSAPYVPKAVVVDPTFDWAGDVRPRTPWSRTVLYECHVRGMTARHPDVPEPLRGTYLGLSSDAVIQHFLDLGVTALELLPVHHALSERALVLRRLTNYWGYNSIGFFAPDARFATSDRGAQVGEFKTMVRRLHARGLEVILDVVYNHTAEGKRLGPTLSFRGLDNSAYYLLRPGDPRAYLDFTGTGNTWNAASEEGSLLLVESLRFWVEEMHVDGFRLDLAPALARGLETGDGLSALFERLRDDPVLEGVKWIAEPWDAAAGGYRLGAFPRGWAEWNDRYRDTLRRYWRGDPGQRAELASRLAGSEDVFGHEGRGPTASIDYVTCHDGFTLDDLVSYETKHNDANGEENRDGTDANWSSNGGVEGPTEDATVLDRRDRRKRNLLLTLAISQGVPMLSHGDEMGRTQAGNNNAYCQDGETTWVDWPGFRADARRQGFFAFAKKVLRLRGENSVFRRTRFLEGRPPAPGRGQDVVWLEPGGEPLGEPDWRRADHRVLGMLLRAPPEGTMIDETGKAAPASTVLLLLNGSPRNRLFRLPFLGEPGGWRLLADTAAPASSMHLLTGQRARLRGDSALWLRWESGTRAERP